MTQSLNHKKSLDQCLKDHFQESDITDKYTCDSCKKTSTRAKKRHLIVKMPKIMVFHIKRFDNGFKKITSNTKYQPDIDMEKYVQINTDNRYLFSYCCPDADPEILGKTTYSLFALTVHQGTINNGHYVAYAKRYNQWYNFNDEYFETVSERIALGQEAYLLFYKQDE